MMGFSSLAVMANSLLLQFEGRRHALPRPKAQQQRQAEQRAEQKQQQQQQQAKQPAAGGGNGAAGGHVAPA